VFLYGFDDLHPLQRDAVETLAGVVGVEVTLSLTYEPGRAALAARAEAAEELRPLAQAVHELPALDEHYAAEARAALHHLERGLFEPGRKRLDPAPERAQDGLDPGPVHGRERLDPGPAIRLLEAGGERAEAELVAAEVLALLGQGVPAEDIAVVYRSLAPAPLIERVFGQYGIPVAGAHELPFGHTAVGRSLLGLGRCALLHSEATAQDLLDYLRAPGLLERPEVIDRLEAEVRRRGFRTAAQAAERLGFPLDEVAALRQAGDPAAELARHARRLLAAPHRGAAAVLDFDEELEARAVAALLRGLDELVELGERPRGAELVELVAELPVRVGRRAEPGAVLISEPLAIRARRFRAVFVCGLQEGEFPRLGAPEPFLSDEYRRELAAAGLRLASREDALARERYLFYACLARATERVVLSYRSSDEEGNLALRSPFVDDVAELLVPNWMERRRRRLLADVVWPADEAPTERELARVWAAAGTPPAGEPARARTALSEIALQHVRHREMLSGGALESFADCPVRWLVERELQIAELEPERDRLARGRYMHLVLERVLGELGCAVTPESLPEALKILERVLDELPADLAPGRSEAVRVAVRQAVAADLRRYLAHEAGDECDWAPSALELRFGFEDEDDASLPALELGEAPKRIRVRGVIDRVDVAADGRRAIVRDYKSGSARPEHTGARWAAERQLQVALYMLAVRELRGLEPVAGVYQPLGGGDLRARGLFLEGLGAGSCLLGTDARSPEELEAELAGARERALALAARLRAGELEPCPETCSRDGCKYPGICRSS
jgi:RecB family exonuclease